MESLIDRGCPCPGSLAILPWFAASWSATGMNAPSSSTVRTDLHGLVEDHRRATPDPARSGRGPRPCLGVCRVIVAESIARAELPVNLAARGRARTPGAVAVRRRLAGSRRLAERRLAGGLAPRGLRHRRAGRSPAGLVHRPSAFLTDLSAVPGTASPCAGFRPCGASGSVSGSSSGSAVSAPMGGENTSDHPRKTRLARSGFRSSSTISVAIMSSPRTCPRFRGRPAPRGPAG
jgi:hypothetical protein